MKKAQLITDQMRTIKCKINQEYLKEAALWALWVSRCQGVLRDSGILRKLEDRRKS